MKVKDLTQIDDVSKIYSESRGELATLVNFENIPENVAGLEIVKLYACNDTLYIITK